MLLISSRFRNHRALIVRVRTAGQILRVDPLHAGDRGVEDGVRALELVVRAVIVLAPQQIHGQIGDRDGDAFARANHAAVGHKRRHPFRKRERRIVRYLQRNVAEMADIHTGGCCHSARVALRKLGIQSRAVSGVGLIAVTGVIVPEAVSGTPSRI